MKMPITIIFQLINNIFIKANSGQITAETVSNQCNQGKTLWVFLPGYSITLSGVASIERIQKAMAVEHWIPPSCRRLVPKSSSNREQTPE